MHTTRSAGVVLFFLLCPALGRSQTADPEKQGGSAGKQQTQQPESNGASTSPSDGGTQSQDQKAVPAPVAPAPAPPVQTPSDKKTEPSEGEQTKRILWVVPNFGAVNANTQLPPLTVRGKFVLATEDSADYSAFVWAGLIAGQSMALNSYPELHTGAAGYGRYYWRAFADQAIGTFFTEAIVPVITHEDPRYYTRGHGGFFRRTGYALSSVVITKTDSGGKSFNFSEIVGNAMGAGLSNLYYPPEERGWSKTAENWGTGLEAAALNAVIKEFWPDIRRKVLRQK